MPVRTRPKAAFYEGLPRVRGAVTALLREEGSGRVLVWGWCRGCAVWWRWTGFRRASSPTGARRWCTCSRGPSPPAEAAGLRPDGVELSAARSASPGELEGLLPALLARRIGQAVRADDAGSVAYLEDGRPVDWER
ncbi:NUDIX hydrolase [Nocardiopsis composta]|uniref:Uncharacterized protein n=1 Tax=Nocardiopsis composta TaxID=157465 RepID=A0A7W8QHZ0_9ACTN|nr:NUDIX hydrolase [Nocardiopsis composta]MBB5430696.1 hypothetical protein [Nocardiopsis composta]